MIHCASLLSVENGSWYWLVAEWLSVLFPFLVTCLCCSLHFEEKLVLRLLFASSLSILYKDTDAWIGLILLDIYCCVRKSKRANFCISPANTYAELACPPVREIKVGRIIKHWRFSLNITSFIGGLFVGFSVLGVIIEGVENLRQNRFWFIAAFIFSVVSSLG